MVEGEQWIGHRTVTADAVATFGALTADYSRIHLDHELGAATPAGRGFAHGLLSASWALGALTLYRPERVGREILGAFVSEFSVRFARVVSFGDTLGFRCDDANPPAAEVAAGWHLRSSDFWVANQAGDTVTSGGVTVCSVGEDASVLTREASSVWPTERYQATTTLACAEDMLENGPRGASRVRTLTEADVVGYCNFTGELNPLYIDSVFAGANLFGARTVPPMLCFCLGFSSWLLELMRLPMAGSQSSAGHLGDRWRFVAPVFIGDTLDVRYRPLRMRRTRSEPVRGIVTFGLQLVNQDERLVQEAEVDMMLDVRDASAARGR